MRLKPILRSDFSRWLELRQRLFTDVDEGYHVQEMDITLASPDAAAFFCITDDGEVAGFLEVSLRNFVDGCLGGPVGYLESMYLEPAFRGKGLGRKIVEEAAAWFRRRGCSDMATDTELENEAAQAFFLGIGFTETFRIVEFKRALGPPIAGSATHDNEDGT